MNMRLYAYVAAIVSLALLASLVSAAGPGQWPRFRGPNGAGVADGPNIPVQWTDKDYNWKVELPGGGHSSPVVWGDRLFVTSGMPDTAKRIITCLRTADGGTLWKREFESAPCKQNDLNSYATTTPAVDKDRVYFSWATPEKYMVVALDHDGREVWQRDLGPFISQHGHGGSPIAFEDLVIVASEQEGPKSFLAALDSKTGQVRWQCERRSEKAAYSTPCLYQPEGGPPQVIFTSQAHGVTAVDPKTGKVIWDVSDAFPKRVVGSPIVASGLVIGACGEGGAGMHTIAVRPPKAGGKAEVAYKIPKCPYVPMPVAKDGLMFLWSDTGTALCIRTETGQEVWREKVGGNYYSSPLWVGNRIYNISTKGEVVVMAAAEKYELLGRTPLNEKCHATPAVVDGRMYIRTWSHLMSIGKP
jgi:outer membrane protein assembly factor BamB